jgi:hypothetical protein
MKGASRHVARILSENARIAEFRSHDHNGARRVANDATQARKNDSECTAFRSTALLHSPSEPFTILEQTILRRHFLATAATTNMSTLRW